MSVLCERRVTPRHARDVSGGQPCANHARLLVTTPTGEQLRVCKTHFNQLERYWRGQELQVEVLRPEVEGRKAVKRHVTYNGSTYTVRSDKVEIPDLESMDRFGALIWLNQNTYAKGPRSKPNPLAGLADVINIRTR